MKRPILLCLVLMSIAAGASRDAAAQNLVLNAGFNANTANWVGNGPGMLTWSTVDANGSGVSGSGLLTNTSATANNGLTLSQCLPMPARVAFRFSGKVMVPSGTKQALSNTVRVDVRFATNSTCSAFPLSSLPLSGTVTEFDTWTMFGPAVLVAPEGTVAVAMRGLLTKTTAGGTAIAHYDDLFAESDTLFLNSFE